jgi:hypothetical protein
MIKHIDCWIAFARQLGLGIEQMEDIVLVTGYHRAMSWANVVFPEGHTDAQASFGVEVIRDPAITVKWHFFPSRSRGAMCSWGPEGKARQFARDNCWGEVDMALTHIRTSRKISAYLFEGFALFVALGYCQGSSEVQQDQIRVRTGITMTMSNMWNSYRCPMLQW